MKTVRLALCFLLLSSAANAAYNCDAAGYAKANALLDKMFKAHIAGLRMAGATPLILIPDIAWLGTSYDDKEYTTQELMCAVAGEDKSLLNFEVRSSSTGQVLGSISGGSFSAP